MKELCSLKLSNVEEKIRCLPQATIKIWLTEPLILLTKIQFLKATQYQCIMSKKDHFISLFKASLPNYQKTNIYLKPICSLKMQRLAILMTVSSKNPISSIGNMYKEEKISNYQSFQYNVQIMSAEITISPLNLSDILYLFPRISIVQIEVSSAKSTLYSTRQSTLTKTIPWM